MSIEDLLLPRYKVIADYPGNNLYAVGSIIDYNYPEWGIDKYPHLFKKLKWYEERNIEDMPQHVKWVEDKFYEVYKVQEWTMAERPIAILTPVSVFTMCKNAFPATETEYNEYQSKQTT